MAHTIHGHYILGTEDEEFPPDKVEKCGGPSLCSSCAIDVIQFWNDEKERKRHASQSSS